MIIGIRRAGRLWIEHLSIKQKKDVDGRKDLLEVDECLCHK